MSEKVSEKLSGLFMEVTGNRRLQINLRPFRHLFVSNRDRRKPTANDWKASDSGPQVIDFLPAADDPKRTLLVTRKMRDYVKNQVFSTDSAYKRSTTNDYQGQTRPKTGTESHGSSIPPRSHGWLPEGPKIAGLRMADIDQYQGRAMRLTQPNGD